MQMSKNTVVLNSNMAQNPIYAISSKMQMSDNTVVLNSNMAQNPIYACILYTSDAADERTSVELGRRSIINKQIEEK